MLLDPPGIKWSTSFASDFKLCCLADKRSPTVTQYVASVKSSSLLIKVLSCDLFDNLTD